MLPVRAAPVLPALLGILAALVAAPGCGALRVPLPGFGGPEKIVKVKTRVPRTGE